MGRTAGTEGQAKEMLDELHTQRDESKKGVLRRAGENGRQAREAKGRPKRL